MRLEDIEELLKLKKENPDMEIVFQCDPDIFAGDDEGTFVALFTSVEKSFYSEYGGRVYLDPDDLEDAVRDNLDFSENDSDDSFGKKVMEEMNHIEQGEKIIVWLGV
jgi:hypothetical protein